MSGTSRMVGGPHEAMTSSLHMFVGMYTGGPLCSKQPDRKVVGNSDDTPTRELDTQQTSSNSGCFAQ